MKKTNPNKAKQTQSEADIPTAELLGIFKPGTNFKGKKMCLSCQWGEAFIVNPK